MATNTSEENTRKRKAYGKESVDSWGSTDMEEESFTYLWIIKNYSAFSLKEQPEQVMSPVFHGGPNGKHKWQLKIIPKIKLNNQELFSVFLGILDFGEGINSNDRVLKTRFEISLLDALDKPLKQSGIVAKDFIKSKIWWGCCWQQTILSSTLLIVDNTLKIHCRVWIEGEVKEKTGNGPNIGKKERILKEKEELQKDLGALLQSSEFADVAINTRTKTFMAHKNVLTCRSKVFAAMFANKMLESSMNTVEILDFEEDIVGEMVKYMYTGELESIPDDKACGLLQIAEKYDLQGLKKECEYKMTNNFSVETAIEILVVANLHNADMLKSKVIDFINRNKEAVLKTTAFQNVAACVATNPEMILKLIYLS